MSISLLSHCCWVEGFSSFAFSSVLSQGKGHVAFIFQPWFPPFINHANGRDWFKSKGISTALESKNLRHFDALTKYIRPRRIGNFIMKYFIPPNRNSFIRISFVCLIYNSLQRMVLQPLRVTYLPTANVPLLFSHHLFAADDKRSTVDASLRYEIQNCHAIVWISHKSFFRGASRGWPLNIDFTDLENKWMKKKKKRFCHFGPYNL